MAQAILSIQNIVKRYPGVVALKEVSIDFQPGEIHALLGENGAGKSTLIKMLTGAEQPDEGRILFDGKEHAMTPALSGQLGIQAIYQEFNLLDGRPVYENIFIGNPICKRHLVDKEAMRAKTRELIAHLNVQIDPDRLVRDLSVAYKQMIEIAKALSHNVKVLIMDEPTAAITDAEVKELFRFLRELKRTGVAIIFISHRIEEIFEIADCVTVMRDGAYIGTRPTSEVDRQQLVSMMVGRELKETYPIHQNEPGEPALELEHLTGKGFTDISLTLRRGEILGLSGLVGAGRTEVAYAVFGASPAWSGAVKVFGKPVEIRSTRQAIREGIGLIPEDRKGAGLIQNMTISRNIVLPSLGRLCNRLRVVNTAKERQIVEEQVRALSVKTPSAQQQVKNLSGGNQQKVVLAKWLATDSRILIFDEPTRGVDVGAKQEIYQLMCELAESGKAILLISSDMEEILGMADRIIVLSEGHYAGEVPREEYSQERLMELAASVVGREFAS